MDDFHGLLARDFGLRPQGKDAPMSSTSTSARGSATSRAWDAPQPPPRDAFDDVFGRPARVPPPAYESAFDARVPQPVFDKPVYDDDLFEGIPGLKSASVDRFDDVFRPAGRAQEEDDLLQSLSGKGTGSGGPRGRSPPADRTPQDVGGNAFDDLLQGFGVSVPAGNREYSNFDHQHSFGTTKTSTAALNDPFAEFGIPVSSQSSSTAFVDPLENLQFTSKDTKFSVRAGGFDDVNIFDRSNTSTMHDKEIDQKQASTTPEGSNRGSSAAFDDIAESLSGKKVNDGVAKNESPESLHEHPLFDTPIESPVHKTSLAKHGPQNERKFHYHDTREEQSQEFDNIWLTVSEVPLFTQPTRAPPPSRPPPPLDVRRTSGASTEKVASNNSYSRRNASASSFPHHSENRAFAGHSNGIAREFGMFSVDGPEEKSNSRIRSNIDDHSDYGEDFSETNSAAATSAAAMKDAMDRAEAKFKYARELRDKEKEQRSFRTREFAQLQQTNILVPDFEETDTKETPSNFDFDRERKEKEAIEERRRIERERQKAVTEKAMKEAQERAAAEARQKAQRAAVEKANAEARERAARAAVLRAESEARAAAEAREKAAKEAKERAVREAREREGREREAREREAREREAREREAREREAREREAREREVREREAREREAREREVREREAREREAREKATRDRERAAVERAAEDARRRAARAAVEKVNAEARERAAAAAAAAAKEKQSKNDNDLDSFFGMGNRANSQPKQRATGMDPFESQVGNQGGSNGARSSSTGPSSTIRKASSATNILDDLSSVFGAPPQSGEFQEIDGESEERRKARFERHQRTMERAAKALADKNERDMQIQREQAERHRISGPLDVEIKRWSAGKEGNLRALLSTLQYVVWPECGWQPVSLTDLITSASVKKVYRKATLCIHPDKVQQKGATLQQKYISEKVFDLLKEAWNKFNSEELF